jgi:hypothetical protein
MQSHKMLVSQKQHIRSTYLTGMFHRNNCDKEKLYLSKFPVMQDKREAILK